MSVFRGELQTFTVIVNDDNSSEPTEKFTVALSNPVNGTLNNGGVQIATVTIVDNDAIPTLTVTGESVTEGDSGTKSLTFTLTLSNPSSGTITLTPTFGGTALNPSDYTYAGGNVVFTPGQTTQTLTITVNGDYSTLAGTATDGTDYIGITGGTIIIFAGQTTGTITVPIVTDNLDEPNETFSVQLTGATNAIVAPGGSTATGTIIDDDATPVVSIGTPVIVTEGALATFTVTLSGRSASDVVVTYSTVNGTAIAGQDYTGATNQTVTVLAGSLTATFDIATTDDLLDEPTETFMVNLVSATNATVSVGQNSAVGQINDNDNPPNVTLTGPVTALDSVGTMPFVVQIDAPSGQNVTVNYTITGSGAFPATAGVDFTGTTGTVTILAGDTTATIFVPIVNDGVDEEDETFTVALTSATNATITPTPNTAIGTITDDDTAPTVSINDVTVTEGTGGTTTFTVTLSAASGRTVMVNYTTADNTATIADGD